MISSLGRGPTKGELRSGNSFSCLGNAPLGKVAMETSAAKKAAVKRSPEERLPASRALPVCQPGGQKEVQDKGQGEEKSRNEKSEPNFEYGDEEETKDRETSPAVRSPGLRILRIDPCTAVFAGAILYFEGLHSKVNLPRQIGEVGKLMRDSGSDPANQKFVVCGDRRFSARTAGRRLPPG
jgi:hypothetical protein